uniref:Uncharacterized protein n=1 Tax=Anguilla anguilla TaxID=7936 RepID=A0A0E9SK65_ANGAN
MLLSTCSNNAHNDCVDRVMIY